MEPSLPAREINLKACAPEIRTRNLLVDPGIEPRLLRQTVLVGAHCISANRCRLVNKYEDIVMPEQHRHLVNQCEDIVNLPEWRHNVSPRAQLVIIRRVQCLQGKCQRTNPPCKYLHPPTHLQEQLLQTGKQNLAMKNIQAQAVAAASGLQPVFQMAAPSAAGMYPLVSLEL